jgi:hypothetical protein
LLDHQNIVPFVGVILKSGRLPSIVSVWMPKGPSISQCVALKLTIMIGTLRSYLKEEPDASRDVLVLRITRGLNYLHGMTK